MSKAASPAVRPVATANVSADFVFGTLATSDLRVERLQEAARGVRHTSELEPPDPGPGEAVRIRVTVGPEVDADRVTAYVTTDDREPAGRGGVATSGSAIDLVRGDITWDSLSWAYLQEWVGELPAQPAGTLVRYRIEAWSTRTTTERWARDPGENEASGEERPGSFAYHVDEEAIPDWILDAVVYEVFVDRFAGDDGEQLPTPERLDALCGGTLRGVRAHLDHIASLGVTCIWLTPVFPSPSHHGYDATDYGSIEPRLGTTEDLVALLEDAHERGIRILLDFVVNHVSSGHPAFRRATTDRGCEEAGWFRFTRWPDEYDTFFGVRDHPRIDSDHPGARRSMVEHARLWLELGVDGFRCDYANGPSHAFWSAFRAATREVRADSVTLGEVVETPALQRSYRGRLDGCLDFILMQALRRWLAFGELTASGFDAFLTRHLAFVGDGLVMPTFLDNHDMNRFLWAAGGDTRRLRLAALAQFASPGPPIVYYGTEVGLSQRRDVRDAVGDGHPEEARLPMPWDDIDDDLLAFYRRLGACRGASPATWRTARRTLAVNDEAGLLAWACGGGPSAAVVVLHAGSEDLIVPASLAGWELAVATTDGIRIDGDRLVLPAVSGVILRPTGPGATEPWFGDARP